MNDFIKKLKWLLQSRRFYALLVAVFVLILQDFIGMDENTAVAIAGLIAAWIVGDSFRFTGGFKT